MSSLPRTSSDEIRRPSASHQSQSNVHRSRSNSNNLNRSNSKASRMPSKPLINMSEMNGLPTSIPSTAIVSRSDSRGKNSSSKPSQATTTSNLKRSNSRASTKSSKSSKNNNNNGPLIPRGSFEKESSLPRPPVPSLPRDHRDRKPNNFHLITIDTDSSSVYSNNNNNNNYGGATLVRRSPKTPEYFKSKPAQRWQIMLLQFIAVAAIGGGSIYLIVSGVDKGIGYGLLGALVVVFAIIVYNNYSKKRKSYVDV